MPATKTTILQEVIKMRFESIYDRYNKNELTNEEAADILGISCRTFRRKKVRYEEEGFSGLLAAITEKGQIRPRLVDLQMRQSRLNPSPVLVMAPLLALM